MSFKINLPHIKNTIPKIEMSNGDVIDGQEVTLNNNSLIIIGANGSGKSQLGAWIEKHDERVHRIGAQRSLVFGKYIDQKSYEQSVCQLLYGRDKPTPIDNKTKWPWDGESYNYAGMLDDYKYALSAFWAKYSLECEKYINECREFDRLGKKHNNVPEMVTDKLTKIWKSIFPHRDIQIKDAKVTAILNIKEPPEKKEYAGKDMSDGERVVLYLIAQALSIPEGKIIIIDEPEIHIHRSIMNKLWEAIEKERPDCLFIYITHDTQFAACRKETLKIWVKNFDGKEWDLEVVAETQLPDQLLLDILGNRKHVIFVEGTPDSYDTRLYSLIFKDYYIVACGSCTSVITNTKAMNNTPQLHHLKCYGIIDRDYRSECELEGLKKHNIYPLEVAEVENLFLVPELLNTIAETKSYRGNELKSRVEKARNYVIETKFKNGMQKQIHDAVVSEIKFKLSTAEFSDKFTDLKTDIQKNLENLNEQNIDKLITDKTNFYNNAYKSKDYKTILKIFNEKSLAKLIGCNFDEGNYCDYVLRTAENPRYAEKVLNALALYMPKDIPRSI